MKYEYKTQPYRHQRLALNKQHNQTEFANLMGPGTGKSKVILDLASYLWAEGELDTLVILSDNGLHRRWITEQVPTHVPDWVAYESAAWRTGTVNKELAEAEVRCKKGSGRLLIVAINTELMSHPSGGKLVRDLLRGRESMLVLDESQRIKVPSSKRTKAIWSVGLHAKFRRIATGTSVTRGLEDLYSQFRFLNKALIGADTYTAFKGEYCNVVIPKIWVDDGAGGRRQVDAAYSKIVSYRNVDQLQAKIAPYSFVCELEDCVDMPERVTEKLPIPLTPEQKRLYKQLTDVYIAELKSGKVSEAPLAIQRLQKYMQIAAGHVTLKDDPARWEAVPTRRIEACLERFDMVLPRQVIIWCAWQADVEQLYTAFKKAGHQPTTYYGGVLSSTQAVRDRNLDAFKAGHANPLIATSSSGGAGLTINEATVTFLYSYDFDLEHWTQLRARNYRIGQGHKCLEYVAYAPGSADVRCLSVLDRKQDIAKIMQDPNVFKEWLLDQPD